MKILCLHGMGTNADIFKAQTASLRALLPSYFTFDFLEGEHDCAAADGIAEVYPEPYICWYPYPPTLDNVRDAHEMIWNIIAEDGPFDGVMGFSQGAAIAASILLHHEIDTPLVTPPFRFAIFICGSLPFSVNERSGFDLTKVFANLNDPLPGEIEHWKRLASGEQLLREASNSLLPDQIILQHRSDFPEPISRTSISSSPTTIFESGQASMEYTATLYSPLEEEAQGKDKDVFASSLTEKIEALSMSITTGSRICRFHPILDSVRISIPTAHIYGKYDPYFSQSLQLVDMCKKDLVNAVDHGGAHNIPRSEWVNRAIADAIEKTIMKSELML